MSRLHLACAAEGAYVPHSAAMVHSALAHRGDLDVVVHYLHGPRLAHEDRDRLADMVRAAGAAIEFLLVDDERVAALPADERFTSAMWHRLFLPELVPEVERVLYLDVDTIVADALEPLWRTELDDAYLAAVTNVFQENHRWRPRELGLAGPEVYFNSGVLLLNLEAMRREGVTAALLECVATRGQELEWPDQDALNLVLGARRVALHPRWNAMNSLAFRSSAGVFGRRARREARRRPGIRHFEGPGANKPWDPRCRQPQRELYARHRAATPWASVSA